MITRPFKEISDRLDSITSDVRSVSNQVVTATKFGTIAFVLISIVAVTALIVTVRSFSNAH